MVSKREGSESFVADKRVKLRQTPTPREEQKERRNIWTEAWRAHFLQKARLEQVCVLVIQNAPIPVGEWLLELGRRSKCSSAGFNT